MNRPGRTYRMLKEAVDYARSGKDCVVWMASYQQIVYALNQIRQIYPEAKRIQETKVMIVTGVIHLMSSIGSPENAKGYRCKTFVDHAAGRELPPSRWMSWNMAVKEMSHPELIKTD